MTVLTNSQIAETHVFNMYPCLAKWITFVKTASINSMKYDSLSCSQLALICQSAMKTFDYIMLNDLHDYAWTAWTAFNARSKNTLSIKTITLTSTALKNLLTLVSWDIALNQNPTSFSPPDLFDVLLTEVTL
jgi:hypothetical protein